MKPYDVKVKFWGVRGSIPVPGKKFTKYGGNTSCVEVECGDTVIILDAGSGIRNFGLDCLKQNKKLDINILISHTHWDHIQGFPFLPQIYIPGNRISFYGGHSVSTLEHLIMTQMNREYHPVTVRELAADVSFHELTDSSFKINDVEVSYSHLLHPGLSLGFRLSYKGKVISYVTDNEIFPEEEMARLNWDNVGHLIVNSDISIADAQYTLKEYETKVGWGHSSFEMAVQISAKYNVKNFYAYHHDPLHNDKFISKMVKQKRKKYKNSGEPEKEKINIFAAKEGDTLYF